MPQNTAMPIAWRISAPAPLENTSGTTPAMKAIDVIRIGRRRRRLASRAASITVRPWSSSSRANSTIRIAFFEASPTSTNRAIWVKTLLSPPDSFTPASAHRMDIGTIRITDSGRVQLSYWAASTRNTSSTHSGNT